MKLEANKGMYVFTGNLSDNEVEMLMFSENSSNDQGKFTQHLYTQTS